MVNLIKFKLITPEKIVFEKEADSVTLPTMEGEVTILPLHRSYIAALKPGEMVVRKGEDEELVALSGGILEFNDNNLIVLADTAERAEELDIKRAEEAKARAEKAMQEKVGSFDLGEYARMSALIQKHSARLNVAKKHRTRRGLSINN